MSRFRTLISRFLTSVDRNHFHATKEARTAQWLVNHATRWKGFGGDIANPQRAPDAPEPVQLRVPRGALPRCALRSSITDQGLVHKVVTPRSAATGDEITGTITFIRIRHGGLVFQSLDA